MAGATDDHHDVVEKSEDLYRRLSKGTAVIEEASFIRRLMAMFMGTATTTLVGEVGYCLLGIQYVLNILRVYSRAISSQASQYRAETPPA